MRGQAAKWSPNASTPAAAWQAIPSAAGAGNRQGESEAAPQGEVHQIRCELGSWVRGDSTKPRTALGGKGVCRGRRRRLQAGRPCSRTGREFLQASLCGVGAPLLQHGQRIRPRSPTRSAGNRPRPPKRAGKNDVPGMLVTGGVPRIEAAQKLAEGAPNLIIV